MQKIKILLVGYGTNLGGIETYLYNLVKNADKNKFEFSFLVFDYGKKVCFEDELHSEGIKFFKITQRTINYKKFLRDLKNVYINNEFDYIHFNLMDFSCYERITYAYKYSNAKLIIHSHNGSNNYFKSMHLRTRFLNYIGKKKIRKINYLKVSCGNKAGQFMFNSNDYIIFNNGIDIDKFCYDEFNRRKIRNELNIKQDEIVYGLVAAFNKVKNHTFLIEIFNHLLKLNNNCKLLLIGEGIEKNNIIKLIDNLNIKDKVILTGKRNDVNEILSAIDCYVMPSISEGLSISLVEAQVNGLKCYTSDGVDKNSNITGNVEFLSLKKTPKEWAEYIYKSNNKRDKDVLNKIPDEFNSEKSYQKVFEFYQNNLK